MRTGVTAWRTAAAMAKNVEVKARVADPAALSGLLATISETPGESIQQEDTFFHVGKGRLKLREEIPANAELIFYDRDETPGARVSFYKVYRTSAAKDLREVLSHALGVAGTVKKRRLLYRLGQVRVHLDSVEGLGHFVELEFVLNPGQEVAEGVGAIDHLMARLGICRTDLLGGAYLDLMVTG